jgi:hypothetical protein
VDTPYRNGPTSLRLAIAFFGQTGVDMCLNGSASKVASRLMLGLKAQPIASEDYDLSYFWIMRRHAFASAALRKKRIPAPGLLAGPVALGLWATDLLYNRRKRKQADVRRLSNFGEAFDVFWDTLRKGPGRLRAVRTAAALEWRFGNLLRSRQAAIFGAFRGQELLGYVVLREATREHLELRQFVIADLQALDDSPEVLTDLLIAAIEATRHEGMDALEWQGWNPAKRRVASSLHPMTYRYPVWQLFYKAINPELGPVLKQPAIWDFSPFDAF